MDDKQEQEVKDARKEKYKQFIEFAVERAKQNSYGDRGDKQLAENSIEYGINSELLRYDCKDYDDFAIFAQGYCSKNNLPLTALLIAETASDYIPEMKRILPTLNVRVAERYEKDIEFSNDDNDFFSTEYGKRLAKRCNSRFSLAAQHYSDADSMEDAMRCELKSNHYVAAAEIAEQEKLLSKEEIKEIYEKGFEYEMKEKQEDYDKFREEAFDSDISLIYADKQLGTPLHKRGPSSLEICAEKLGLMNKVIKFYELNGDPFSLAEVHSRQGNYDKLKEDYKQIDNIVRKMNWQPPRNTFYGSNHAIPLSPAAYSLSLSSRLGDFSNAVAINAWRNIHELLKSAHP